VNSLLGRRIHRGRRATRILGASILAAALSLTAMSVPARAAAPTDGAIISAQLQQLVSPTLTAAQNILVRTLIRNAALEQFDGDTDVLLTDVIARAEQDQIVDPNDDAWLQFKNLVLNFAPVNGHAYLPQILIPNLDDTAVPGDTIVVAVQPPDEATTSLTGYALDGSGQVGTVGFALDEAYAEAHEVWVLSVNEETDPPTGDGGAALSQKPAGTAPAAPVTGATGNNLSASPTSASCNPSGIRLNRGVEYLTKFKVPSPSSLENWWRGKLEMRLDVTSGTSGALVSRVIFPKRAHRSIKNWNYLETRLTTWDRNVWGDSLVFQWYEVGPGLKNAGVSVVQFTDSTFTEYNTGSVIFTDCSVGGDGNTGDENYALTATVGASSTFSGYSKDRVNDGSRDTSLGGAYSWANAANTWPPNGTEWLTLDFGLLRTFRRVVVYTTATYPIRDYDIQVLSTTVGWRTIASVRGNTQSVVTTSLPIQTQRQVRLLALSGPSFQPGYVRVNELEVYATP
jgi:F5/8 type C domain